MHGVFPCVRSREPCVLSVVVEIEVGNVWLHAHPAVGISEQRLYADEHLGDGEREAPVMQDRVEPNVAMPTDVRVIKLCDEAHYWRPHWIAIQYIKRTNIRRTA